jgi:putative ABC transport system ATP-binding protein
VEGVRFRFEDVTVVAGGATILDHVMLDVPAAGITVFAGPSGAGKSTLLRLCNRLEVPSTGRIFIDGTDIATIDPLTLRRRAGMVFQSPARFAGTVTDTLRVACGSLSDDQALAVLHRVGLGEGFVDRQADDLSGGEAQRMCIARALLTDPEVLLMDEATSALDVDARLMIEALARELVEQGLTIVWVTHDLEQAQRLADRTTVILGGRIASEDEAARCLAARSFLPARDRGEADADGDHG